MGRISRSYCRLALDWFAWATAGTARIREENAAINAKATNTVRQNDGRLEPAQQRISVALLKILQFKDRVVVRQVYRLFLAYRWLFRKDVQKNKTILFFPADAVQRGTRRYNATKTRKIIQQNAARISGVMRQKAK
ncbi:MAG TPA: hypothetical protein VFB72_14085 [Verrucomicrobiae bacterium]|nr:hypothetical protein [Verrucomicrobiae bacterium]